MGNVRVTRAAFLAVLMGGAAASAGTTANLLGSDTLYDFTNAIIAACNGAVGPYADTGSINGQAAMESGSQTVAPMSTFLNGTPGACSTSTDTASEGLVVGLDGIAILGWNQSFTSAGCNGTPNLTCAVNPLGAAHSTTITCGPTATLCSSNLPADGNVYTLTGWRDVLRILLAGFDHSAVASGTDANAWAARDCNSAIRNTIANNYGTFFETSCTSPGGSTATGTAADSAGGHCTIIRHIFRPDDFSGTSDMLVKLLGLPSIVLPTAARGTGASPFCNAVRPAFVFSPAPTCLVGSDRTWDPTVCIAVGPGPCTAANVEAHTCTDPGGVFMEKGVYRAAMQDNDPIRRPCATSEQVCDHCKNLGMVLPMSEPLIKAPLTGADRYHATLAAANTFAAVPIPEIFDAITQQRILAAQGALCPNGDIGSTGCIVPATAGSPANNPQVLSRVPNGALLVLDTTPSPTTCPSAPGLAEGRQYNQHLYGPSGYITNGYKVTGVGPGGAPNGIPVTGAYYRIHTTSSLNAGGRTCQFPDMTDQIGCLVEASPCSLGIASQRALASNPNSGAVKVNGQSPVATCIQGDNATVPAFRYPLSRKLYFSTLLGFGAVTAQELQLAGCMTDLGQPAWGSAAFPLQVPTDPSLVTLDIAPFFVIPPWVNGGHPYCEDFNENMLCGATTNSNACNTPHANFNAWVAPAATTTCGNGILEPFEECDCGTFLPMTLGGHASLPDPTTAAANRAFCEVSHLPTVNGGVRCSTICRSVL